MRYRDDYERERARREAGRYGSDRPGPRDDFHGRDLDRRPDSGGDYICDHCGSDAVSPRRMSARDVDRGRDYDQRSRYDYDGREYGHQDEFDRESRMGILDVPHAGYRSDPDDWWSEPGGRNEYRDHWGGSESRPIDHRDSGRDRYPQNRDRSTLAERSSTRGAREENRGYNDRDTRDGHGYSRSEYDRDDRYRR